MAFPIHGVLPVLQLPLNADESIDWATLREEVDWVFDLGADGIVAAMVTEILRLTEEEKDLLATRLVEFANGRGPVVMSVGAESLYQAERNARAAASAGVDALMAIPPVANRTLAKEVIGYYEGILQAVNLPLIVQDASGYVGTPLPIQLQADLFNRFPERIAFKPEAQPLGQNLSLLRDATGGAAAIFEGSGGIALLDAHNRGIAGTMPGAEMVWAVRDLWDHLESGRMEDATTLQGVISSIISLQVGLDGFLAVEKHLLRLQSVFKSTCVRGPVGYVLDPETADEVERLFRQLHQICNPRFPLP